MPKDTFHAQENKLFVMNAGKISSGKHIFTAFLRRDEKRWNQ